MLRAFATCALHPFAVEDDDFEPGAAPSGEQSVGAGTFWTSWLLQYAAQWHAHKCLGVTMTLPGAASGVCMQLNSCGCPAVNMTVVYCMAAEDEDNARPPSADGVEDDEVSPAAAATAGVMMHKPSQHLA